MSSIDEIGRFTYNKQAFYDELHDGNTEIIEVKEQLTRSVIGQALVGRTMFEMDYDSNHAQTVVLCSRTSPALEVICDMKDVRFEQQ